MELEDRTKAKILKFFGNKVCSRCGKPAERYSERRPFCQKCHLILTLKKEPKEPSIREVHNPFEEGEDDDSFLSAELTL